MEALAGSVGFDAGRDSLTLSIQALSENRDQVIDLALLAMGFLNPEHAGMLEQLDVELDEKGLVKAGERDFRTNIPKVFCCGDMRKGQSLVVWAISEGRECARKVDEHLMGQSLLPSKDKPPTS